jgi:uncharacterized protein (DUF2147 family)
MNIVYSWKITGNWEVHDLRFPEQKMIARVTQKNGEYQAAVSKVKGLCHHCHGEYQHKNIKDKKIFWGFKVHSKNLYDEGYFLDTHSGRIYRARIKVYREQLFIRTFIGLPLFGQTHIWQRYHP